MEALFAQAQTGDPRAFEDLVLPYRHLLTVHAYKMTGSYADAEDLVQETLVRAWKNFGGLTNQQSLKSWLFRITTNECLRMLSKRASRGLPFDQASADPTTVGDPVAEDIWLEPFLDDFAPSELPDPEAATVTRVNLELAFIHLLQRLPTRQRAMLILVEGFGFSLKEVAEILDTSVAAVNSALQRARKAISQKERARPPAINPDILQQYVAAWENKDLHLFKEILRHDATYSMPPWREWFKDREEILNFFAIAWQDYEGFRFTETRTNTRPGFLVHARKEGEWRRHSIHMFEGDNAIQSLIIFRNPRLLGALSEDRPWRTGSPECIAEKVEACSQVG